jgi:hypothetical protein
MKSAGELANSYQFSGEELYCWTQKAAAATAILPETKVKIYCSK